MNSGKQSKLQTTERLSPLTKSYQRQTDISKQFTRSCLQLIVKGAQLAHYLHSPSVMPAHLILADNHLDKQDALDRFCQKLINEQPEVPPYQNGLLLFSPYLRKTLLAAAQLSQTVSRQVLIQTVLLLPEFKHLKRPTLTTLKPPTPNLDRLATRLHFDPSSACLDRRAELKALLTLLSRSQRQPIALVGNPGVGKTILINQLIKQAKSFNFFFLNENQLNQAELKALSLELTNNNILLLNLAGRHLLKPLLEQTNNLLIELNSSVWHELDPDLKTRLAKISLEPAGLELTEKILVRQSQELSRHHQIKIEKAVFSFLPKLIKRYLDSEELPKTALDILDTACAEAKISQNKIVNQENINRVVASKVNIPIQKLTVSEQEKLMNLESALSQDIIGQKQAIKLVAATVRRSRSGLSNPRKPLGSFLFLGPTGVGKTELAKSLAKLVFDTKAAFFRLDMSEFSQAHTVQRLIGAPPGYVGYEAGGQLTNPVKQRPFSLILLDEIEKAHPAAFDIFLSVLDEGRLTDSHGRVSDFKNTIIIATSNIAAEKILKTAACLPVRLPAGRQGKAGLPTAEELLPLLKQHFRAEFINRFDNIVIFHPLNIKQMRQIADLKIKQLAQRLKEQEITLIIKESTLNYLAQASFAPEFGARKLERFIRDNLENTIANLLIKGELKRGDKIEF